MQIIPVLDLKGGVVVHAQGGDRAQYAALKSTLTAHRDVSGVIKDLHQQFAFTVFYLADLDAIENQQQNPVMYQKIATDFPEIIFWLDAGFSTLSQIEFFAQKPNIRPVMASETLKAGQSLTAWQANRYVLSLDFKQAQLLGDAQLLAQFEDWPAQVIIMNLDAVGSRQGPDIAQLHQLKMMSGHTGLVAAGGVRDQQDLNRLEAMGIHQALVATALHDGRLKP